MAIEVGNVFEGRVTGVKPFGAFVALPEGRVGMVHISEVSNEFVQDIAAVLHDGDTVKVQVMHLLFHYRCNDSSRKHIDSLNHPHIKTLSKDFHHPNTPQKEVSFP